MKTFEEFLAEKGYANKEAFDKLDVAKQLELYNEYNAELKKSFTKAVEDKATSEELSTLKAAMDKSNESIIKSIESLALTIKAQAEKGGYNPETMEKSELIKLMEEASKDAGKDGKGRITSRKANVNARHLLAEINKAAALMTTANIIGIGSNSEWSPLFGNYIDSRIHRAPLLYSTIMEDITVTTQEGTENITWTERVNEDGDAEWLDEGEAKPLADAEWHTFSEKSKEVAVFWKFTTRFLFHTRLAVEDFQKYARELMENKIPNTALLGDATVNPKEIDGITTLASAWVVPPRLAGSTSSPNVYDAVLALATAIRIRGFKGMIVVRLNDVYSYLMKSATKDALGNYIVPPFSSPDGTRVSDVRVKFDSELPDGKILGGVLANYNLVICEDIIYDEGHENDDFRKNLVSRKLEAFVGSYLPGVHKPSIIYADIDDILGDIEDITPVPPVVLPVIASISPTSGQVGDTITLTGTGFSQVTSVTFGTTNAPVFTVVSATSITVNVPTMAIGVTHIEVANANGTSNAVAFTVAP